MLKYKTMKSQNTIPAFLWHAIKPYKWKYLLMLQAPIVAAFYPIVYSYCAKLLIDLFTQNETIAYNQAFWPLFYFIGMQVLNETAWRIHNLASWHSIPHILQRMMTRVFDYVSNHSYSYFQNHLSGSMVAKMKGIGDNYHKIHTALEYDLTAPLMTAIIAGFALFFINLKLFSIVVIFACVNIPYSVYFYKRIGKLEQARQESWYKLFGNIADSISNIFTIFSFAKRQQESDKIQEYYNNVHNPLAFAWHKFDFWGCIVLSLINWAFMISLFLFMIHLKNIHEIGIGDIAFTMSAALTCAENTWKATLKMKDFIEYCAMFKSSFSILQTPQETIDKKGAKELIINI